MNLPTVQPPTTYPLAPSAVARTIQGEGTLLGIPMVFLRLAGCSQGCRECDTDYRVAERATVEQIADRVRPLLVGSPAWIWVTGGEPTDHDLPPLFKALRAVKPGVRIALATAGVKLIPQVGKPDWISVSPHSAEGWVQREGQQLNLVPGLNGLSLSDPALLKILKECEGNFGTRWVTPLAGDAQSEVDCFKWMHDHPNYRLGIQAHLVWGMP